MVLPDGIVKITVCVLPVSDPTMTGKKRKFPLAIVFDRPGVVGSDRHDDDVDPVIDNERPSSRPQNRSPNGGYNNAGNTQQPPTRNHALHDI